MSENKKDPRLKNLKSFNKMSPEKHKEISRKGGYATAKARSERKKMAATLEMLLDLGIRKGQKTNIENLKSIVDVKNKNITVEEAILVVLTQKAMSGDLKAIEMIRDMLGEKPTDTVDLKATFNDGKLGDILAQLQRGGK